MKFAGGKEDATKACGSTARIELAKKIERKKMSTRDENRHLDVKREVNFRMSALIDRVLGAVRQQEAFGGS